MKIIEIDTTEGSSNIGTIINTSIKDPIGFKLISAFTKLGSGTSLTSLNISGTFPLDYFNVVIGKSKDGYIQYSVTNAKNNGLAHRIILLFTKI